jgi:hypothetical protein
MKTVEGVGCSAVTSKGGLLVCLLAAACGPSALSFSVPGDGSGVRADAGAPDEGAPDDAGSAGKGGGTPKAGPPADAATADADAPEAGPVSNCASTSSISALLSQYGTDSTVSTITPMGKRFENAAQAGPLSAANAAFLTTPSSNPPVAQATSATGLEWSTVTIDLYPSGKPSPEDITQHALGDCDGDSAMASMAYVNPALVQSIITDHHDGTYDIAMFDPMGKPIRVAVDAQVLVDTGNTGSVGQVSARDGTADWATLLEKAVMKYDYAYGTVGPIDGIGSEALAPMFTGTGGSIAFPPGSLTPAQLQQVVTVSLAAGKFITGGFNQVLPIGQDETVTGNGYAVMVPSDPTTGMADMRSPWGLSPWASSSASGYDTSADGLLRVPLSTTPTDWANVVDLRIIDPGPHCSGVSTPFTPQ